MKCLIGFSFADHLTYTCKIALEKQYNKKYRQLIESQRHITKLRGAGGIRTLVQTGKPYAFYTLIPDFGFRAPTRPGPPIDALAPKSHPCIGACKNYFRFSLRRLIFGFGTTSSERRLVLLPCKRIKPVIYCTSIRQRERNCFRQLIFPQLRLWREPRSLRVLTYHLNPLSNPVNPRCDLYRRKCPLAHFGCKDMNFSLSMQIISEKRSTFAPIFN